MKAMILIGVAMLTQIASGAPMINGYKALPAPGEKFTSRVAVGVSEGSSRRLPLEKFNALVNDRIQYESDERLYGKPDHWAKPDEIAASLAGDCEDYALYKYWSLRRQGLPAKDMFILVFYDKVVRIHHAVLVVKQNGKELILDNRTDKLIPLPKMTDIEPSMAMNESEFFLYGKLK